MNGSIFNILKVKYDGYISQLPFLIQIIEIYHFDRNVISFRIKDTFFD